MLDNGTMKFTSALRLPTLLPLLVFAMFVNCSYAQSGTGASYKCAGNEYTDKPQTSKNGGCKLLEGGNVTVVQGTRVFGAEPVRVASVAPKATSTNSSGPRNDSAEQKFRDSDSRGILEAELKKAEAKQAELLKEYNNGEPDRNALDIKMPQRYIERVAELKANIARIDSDIAGIKRELGRNQGSTARVN
jgi:hypothetical protein